MLALLRRVFPAPLAIKVPAEITAWFWLAKILTTAAGEATSDWLASRGNIVGGGIEALVLIVGLAWQFRTRRYQAVAYWFLACAVATTGTGISDALHLDVHIPYLGTSILWAVVLAVVLSVWFRYERTLSIHTISTQRREIFYWCTVFSTFALGTAVGDLTATTLGLGFVTSGILFTALIMVPLLCWRWFRLDAVVAFWAAYILTRPLGASFADYIDKPHALSGLNFGNGPTAALLLAAVVGVVAFLAVTRIDNSGAHARRRSPGDPGSGRGHPLGGFDRP